MNKLNNDVNDCIIIEKNYIKNNIFFWKYFKITILEDFTIMNKDLYIYHYKGATLKEKTDILNLSYRDFFTHKTFPILFVKFIINEK